MKKLIGLLLASLLCITPAWAYNFDGSGNQQVNVINSTLGVTQSGTWNINALTSITNALPAGSNTLGAVTQASGPWTISLTQIGGSSLALGQTTMSASVPVTIASNQSASSILQAYGSETAFTITLASLGSASGRQSTIINNTSNLYQDVQVIVSVKTASSSVAATGYYSVYLITSLDDSLFTDGGGASDAAITISNAKLMGSFTANATSTVYTCPALSVAQAAGGMVPPYWGIAVVNNTGTSLNASGNAAQYIGVYKTGL
jgi:hypothetical protein